MRMKCFYQSTGVVFVIFAFVGCQTQPNVVKPQRTVQMDLKVKTPWTKTTCVWLGRDGKTRKVTDAKLIVYEYADKSGQTINLPVTAFVSSELAEPWVGPQQQYYIQTKSGIAGFVHFGGLLTWYATFAKDSLAKPRAMLTVDDVVSDFEHNVGGEQLIATYESYLHAYSDPVRDQRTDFRTIIPSKEAMYFLSAAPGSALGGLPKITGINMDGDLLKVDMENQTGEIKPTIWIDTETKQPVKAANFEYSIPPDARPGGPMPNGPMLGDPTMPPEAPSHRN